MNRSKVSKVVDAVAVLSVFACAASAFALAGSGHVTISGVSGGVVHRVEAKRSDVNMPQPGVCVVPRGGSVLVLDGCTVSDGLRAGSEGR